MKLLKNKVAIITGGGSGIGRAIAARFVSEGASVCVADVDEKGGMETVEMIGDSNVNAIFVKANSANPADNERLVAEVMSNFGGLHLAVNNAGIGGPLALAGDYPVDGWNRVIDINLSG